MRCKALLHGFPLIVAGILILPTLLSAQKTLSHVRVVRLSYVSGTVGVKRPASTEWAKAQTNTPIQEGFEVSTAANSYVEVEFENGSTARLGEFSKLTFDQLAMDEAGNKINRLRFDQGYATFHLLPEHHDAYSVRIVDSTLTPNGKSEFRTDLVRGKVRVEVFAGSVQLESSSKAMKLSKDKILEYDPTATELAANVKQGIVKDSWDKWSFDRDTQAQLALNDQAVSPNNSFYGWSDLGAYGEWGYFPGFGYGWSPFASAGWSPYSMGMWSWYPGMGYTWIGGEPWGWLPYHYGNWNFANGFGWFWMPGSNFNNFSPALVSFYSGPGWVGWAPLGAIGAAGQNMVTAAPGSVLQNGLAVTPQNTSHMPLGVGTRITRMPFQPGAGAMLSGPALTVGAEAFTPHQTAAHIMAPSSILVGGSAERENAFQGRHSAHQPLRVAMGSTLGGAYAVHGTVGEFRGNAFAGAKRPGLNGPEFSRGAGGPMLLPHGQQASIAPHGNAGPSMSSGVGNTGHMSSGMSAASSSSSSAGHGASGSSGNSNSSGRH